MNSLKLISDLFDTEEEEEEAHDLNVQTINRLKDIQTNALKEGLSLTGASFLKVRV